MLDTHGRKMVQPVFDTIGKQLVKWKISPIQITIAALILGILSLTLLYFQLLLLAVITLWLSGILDVLDGTVARLSNQKSDLGALLDITFDRVIELGIIVVLAISAPGLQLMLVGLTASIVMSMTVFLTVGNFAKNYTEKSFYYQSGLIERTEGFVFFSLLMLLPSLRLVVGLVFMLVILITAIQRFVIGIKMLKKP